MTPRQIDLVRASFVAIAHRPDAFAAAFYERLFAVAPETRALFATTDMDGQRTKLMTMLRTAVAALTAPEALLPVLDALGRRHRGYGVQPDHYAAVGQAMIETLAATLSERFTPAVAEAWLAVYALVSQRMQGAAAEMAHAA